MAPSSLAVFASSDMHHNRYFHYNLILSFLSDKLNHYNRFWKLVGHKKSGITAALFKLSAAVSRQCPP
jgi:hypothetical protein